MDNYTKECERPICIAIDVAKDRHVALVETADGKRYNFAVANTRDGIAEFIASIKKLGTTYHVGFEPTGDYHRPLAFA